MVDFGLAELVQFLTALTSIIDSILAMIAPLGPLLAWFSGLGV
jgi:hypothetical protein